MLRPTWHTLSRAFHVINSPIFRSVELAILVASLVYLILTYNSEIKERQNQRLVNAWQIALEEAPGSSGKSPALQYLYAQKQPMFGLNMSYVKHGHPVFLRNLDLFDEQQGLSGAYLPHSSFAGAIMYDADLRKANLTNACLYKANLRHADLTEANLSRADLSGAILSHANLKDAKFIDANVSGTHMQCSTNLRQTQLDDAYYCTESGGRPALPAGMDPPPLRTNCSTSEGCRWSGVKTGGESSNRADTRRC